MPPTRRVSWLAVFAALAVRAALAAEWRAEGPYLAVVNDLALDPGNPAVVYAATSSGGVWRSDDGGATWTLPGDEMTSRKVDWVEADPATSGTVWAGEDNPGQPALWRSRDRGASWESVRGSVKGELGTMHPTGARIAFAPSQPAVILVPSTNLHYRSNDGGKTWTDFRVPGQDAYAFAIDPENPKVFYAGGRGEKHQFSRSEDGGKTWKAAGAGLPESSIKILAVDPHAPATLYAVSGFGDLWRSKDRGDNWSEVQSPVEGTDDITNLTFDPAKPDVLWASHENGLSKSTDAGETWREADRGMGRWVSRDVVFDARDPSVMLAGAAGSGVHKSSDGGASWKPSSQGLAAAWVTKLYVPPAPGPWFAKASVGLFRVADGRWSEVQIPFTDHGEANLDGILFETAAPKSAWAHQGSGLWRSLDGGMTWKAVERKELGMREMMKGEMEQEQFNALVQDAANPKILWAGAWSNSEPGKTVYKTVDGGKTWKPSGKGLPGDDVKILLASPPSSLFAFIGDDGFFKSSDGGATWSAASGPGAKVRSIVVDPSSPGRLFAATEKGLYRSADLGSSWSAVVVEKDGDVEAVVASASGRVFAGTFHGVFESKDGGSTWAPFAPGLPNTDVRALAIGNAPSRLYAGIAGGSVWSIELE